MTQPEKQNFILKAGVLKASSVVSVSVYTRERNNTVGTEFMSTAMSLGEISFWFIFSVDKISRFNNYKSFLLVYLFCAKTVIGREILMIVRNTS